MSCTESQCHHRTSWSLVDPPEEDTVKAHIKSLRQKIKAVGGPNDLIETVHGVGYHLKLLS